MGDRKIKKVFTGLLFAVGMTAVIKIIAWTIIADKHFKKALRAELALEYDKAETELKMALDYKKEPVYYETLAALYRKMGENLKDRNKAKSYYELSVRFYKKLIVLKPDSALAYNGLGAVCLYIGRDYRDEEYFRSAIFNFRKAVELKPSFSDAYVNMAAAYYLWGIKDKALEIYREALDNNPEAAGIYFNRGMLYFLEKNYAKAEEDWQKVIEIEPDNIDALKGLERLRKK